VVTPEALVERERLLRSPFVTQPPVQAAISDTSVAVAWGITGSTGYALATEIPVLHADSDLDLLIRAPAAARGAAHGRRRLANCRAGPIPRLKRRTAPLR
jgi:phosphoribosyl-dephospho-CoA transferase